nr:zinc knuckle CX2CX4HX4C [Tanacetum cinerariifolium]
VPTKFGDIVCVLNDKINDQFTKTDGALQNDDREEIGGNSKAYGSESESELKNESNGGTLNGKNETNKEGNGSQHIGNEQINTKGTPSSSGDSSNSYAGKLVHNDNEANKLIHIPTVLNEKGQEFVIFDEEIVSKGSKKWELSACGYFVDDMTTRTCSLGYARVLVEATTGKGLDDHIDVLYKNKDNGEQFVKKVRVEYDWKPPSCSHCKVFGHSDSKCPSSEPKKLAHEEVKDGEGFINVGRKKRYDNGEKRNMQNNNKPVEKKHGYQKFLYDNGEKRTIISLQRRSMAIRSTFIDRRSTRKKLMQDKI